MSYLALDKILEAREYVKNNIKKPDTFIGIVLFLLCVVERNRNGFYLKSDMKKFSEFADGAFYLSDLKPSYADKYWFALLTNDWVNQVRDYFLRGNRVSANKVMQSIFWSDCFADIQLKSNVIPRDVFDSLFISDLNESDFNQDVHVKNSDLLLEYRGAEDALTIKFDGSFVKKKAGDLSGAPFGQTLYAATEIKKIISIFDFDFIDKFDLTKEDNEIVGSRLVGASLKDQFRSWMLSKGLSERTASSYSGTGISFCDRYISSINLNADSFYGLKYEEVLDALMELQKIEEWLQADKSGNLMYSSACKKLAEFLSERSNIVYTSLSKPFLLLAGISGTGKTRFVRKQAEESTKFAKTVGLTVSRDDIYCLTSVRPDWHEPSDLLGYISRLNGSAEYITTDVLQFITKAWRAIADSGLTIEVQDSEDQGERLVVKGERGELDQVLPYWLCLDEMNLAPVEQYFADYLSVLETREWCWTDDSFTYSSDALLKSATLKEVADKEKLRKALGFDNSENKNYDELWQLVCQYGLGIPFNLLVAGTVNMDETTHGFSRKVIDRALSFDFGEFFPNDYQDFFSPRYENKRLTYPTDSHAKKEMLSSLPDEYGDKSIAFLSAVNDELKNTPFELAYRALNELLLAVVSYGPQDEQSLQAVWDDFMMCKVLPRIEGDEDKLMGSADAGQNILERLLSILENQLAGIWNDGRPDLYREPKEDNDGASLVPCRSKKKLNWMKGQLVRGFVSFWP